MTEVVDAVKPVTLWEMDEIAATPLEVDDIVSDLNALLAETKSFFAMLMLYSLLVMKHGQACTKNSILRHKAAMELRQKGEKILKMIDGIQSQLGKKEGENPSMDLDQEIVDFLSENGLCDFRKRKANGEVKFTISLIDAEKLGVEVSTWCSGKGNQEADMSIAVNEANMNNEAGTKLAKSFLEMLKNLILEIIQALGR